MTQIIGGRYEIIRKVGGGGMAVVYLAKDTYLGREVALKVLRDQYTEDPEFVRHFHKEARAVATLDHPNIVRIYDFDADGQPAYIVMEFVQGPTIKKMILDQGRLSAEEVAEITIQVAHGLGEAHRNHIVHRDVKSHNIMVNQGGQVRITDFGISQMLSNTTITHNKAILGSAHYFSPEQARGEHVSYASDIYSLGIVMYEMATGQLPFVGDNPVTVALKHIQEAPLDPRELLPDLPAGLANIIMICLEKDPADRFADMTALANALENFLRGEDEVDLAHQVAYVPLLDDSIALPRKLTQQAHSEEREIKERRRRKKRPWQSYLIAALLLFLAAFVTIFVARQFMAPSEVIVPDVENMSYERAANSLRRNNLEVDIDGEESSDEVPDGHVIRQSPPAGSILQPGSTVGLILSTGSEEVEVPDLRSLTIAEVKNTLEARDLELGEVLESYDNSIAEGRVISQSVQAGDRIAKGHRVNIVVSLGEEKSPVSVPDLRGQTQGSAAEILANAGLSLGQVEDAYHDSVAQGLVISQSVNPGQRLDSGSRVNITVSLGPNRIEDHSKKTVNLSFTVPESGSISVVQEGNDSRREVFLGLMEAGDQFSRDYEVQGSGRFLIYLNGNRIDEVNYGN